MQFLTVCYQQRWTKTTGGGGTHGTQSKSDRPNQCCTKSLRHLPIPKAPNMLQLLLAGAVLQTQTRMEEFTPTSSLQLDQRKGK